MKEKEKNENIQKDREEARQIQLENIEMSQGSIAENDRERFQCISIIGQIEGHLTAPSGTKTTKYEHVLPLLASIEESDDIDGLLLHSALLTSNRQSSG